MRKQARTWRGVRVARVDPGGTFYARPSAEAGADPEITLCPQPGADECHDGATHVLVHRMKALAKLSLSLSLSLTLLHFALHLTISLRFIDPADHTPRRAPVSVYTRDKCKLYRTRIENTR